MSGGASRARSPRGVEEGKPPPGRGLLLPDPKMAGGPPRLSPAGEGWMGLWVGVQGGLFPLGFTLQGALPHQGMPPDCPLDRSRQAGRPPSATGAAATHPRLPLSSLQGSGWFFPHC